METTNPATEVASPEDRLFEMFKGESKEPPEDDQEPQEVSPETEDPDDGEEVSDDHSEAGEETTADEDSAEIDVDGEKYVVPKKLEAAFLKSRDYTQKTQELAEQRRSVEERAKYIQEMEQTRAAVFEKAVAINAVEQRLKQFEQLDWNQIAQNDQTQYLQLDRAYRELQQQHSKMTQEVQSVITQEQQKSAQQRQQMLERANADLARDVKGWGPELGKKLMDNAKTSYGFQDAELAEIVDPRYVRVLHDAYQWRALQQAKPAIAKKVENAKPVTVKAARSSQTSQQAALIQADRTRLKKTGDPKAAEAALARLFESKRKR